MKRLDYIKLLEHGSSIGGSWLSIYGRNILDILNCWEYCDDSYDSWKEILDIIEDLNEGYDFFFERYKYQIEKTK